MKALVVTGASAIESLSFQQTVKPAPEANQVLVKIKAAGINPVDFMPPVLGLFAPFGLSVPYTMGIDFAGVVEAAGSNVTNYKAGDEVLGGLPLNKPGAFADYVAVDTKYITLKPESLSFEQAAAIPLAGQTAVEALEDHLQIQPGQKILIQAAAGGVGTFAVQLAKIKGAHVTAVGSEHNTEFLKSLGADEVTDYKKGFGFVNGNFDAVLDSKASAAQTIPLLKKGGRYVSLTAPAPQELVNAYNVHASAFLYTAGTDRLTHLANLAGTGALKITLDKTYSAAEIIQALEYQKAGKSRGKNVVLIQP
jgi:NADPH:quinone reductase-like Zn-dependent oxidoreductase